MNRDKHKYQLKDLFPVAGFSKQAHKSYIDRQKKEEACKYLVYNSILEIRRLHPNMGLKKIYNLLCPDWIGRDKFLEIGMFYGLGIKLIKSYHRTTFSTKCNWFFNQTINYPIIDINQVWTSDITYFRMGDVFLYLTFIIDVYSRRILGAVAWDSLAAAANCMALKKALKKRRHHKLKGLIHHSDRGVQYTSNSYLAILKEHRIAVSMCDNVYDNTHIERVNGIIKNEYLRYCRIDSLNELRRELNKSVNLYNNERPHWSLGLKTPAQYESDIKQIPEAKREILCLSNRKKNLYVQQSFF